MKEIYREFLFEKGFLEGKENPKNPLEALLLLGSCFGIEVTSGQRYCDKSMIPYVAIILGEKVPEPFYKGFPESVKNLSGDALLLESADPLLEDLWPRGFLLSRSKRIRIRL